MFLYRLIKCLIAYFTFHDFEHFASLFRHDFGKQSSGDTFVIKGFTNWNKKERLASHVGGPNVAHNIAWRKCQDLMNQNQHIEVVISKQSKHVRDLYRRRLTASIDCIRFLLKQGLAFRGHDESTNSANQGNFLELLRFLAKHNESINHVVLENAPEKAHKMSCHVWRTHWVDPSLTSDDVVVV